MVRQNLTFTSRLKSVPTDTVNVAGTSLSEAQLKKRGREKFSLKYASEKIGFLHALLIEVNGLYFLIAGPSGVGKSTTGKFLQQKLGAKVLANDWVTVEKNSTSVYASDLNFDGELKHTGPCKIAAVFFMSFKDYDLRDAFVPNSKELKQLLHETFDEIPSATVNPLTHFWLTCDSKSVLCAIPSRIRSENVVKETIKDIIETRFILKKPLEKSVGVIGLGSVGSLLAFELGRLDFINNVQLFTRSTEKAIGYCLDMNQARLRDRNDIFKPAREAESLFKNCSSIFLCTRDENAIINPNLPERWRKIGSHLKIVEHYAKLACQLRYKGTIFVVTNPVDMLAFAFYFYGQNSHHPLRSHQIFGVGLELDFARGLFFLNTSNPDAFTIYGNHSDILQIKKVKGVKELLDRITNASPEIRRYVPKTLFGPVESTIKTYLAFEKDGSCHVTAIQKNSFLGQKVKFVAQLPSITNQNKELDELINSNKANTKTVLG